MTAKKFADRLNYEKSNIYKIFQQESMDIDKLRKISEVLNYDFITEVYAMKND